VVRRGKRVAIELDGELRLVIGLGMSGHVSVAPAIEPVPTHTHLRIAIGDGERELRFRDPRRFGGLWLLNGRAEQANAGFVRLGPEPLTISSAEFRRIMSRRRQVKALLMDQSAIAGLGNIYCDEALYRAGIHPLERAVEVDARRVERLRQAIRRVLTEAIKAEGSSVNTYMTANGAPGGFQYRLRVYGREGEPCVRCGVRIERIVAAGRSSHFCPMCQRANPKWKMNNGK
jgi:formamidopyrimidine-DNA glycosylase